MSPESAVSLSSLLCAFDECELQDLLSTFSCRDESIANFLKRQAIEFEKASKSRTYLFIDDQSDKEIAGFFSVAISNLYIPEVTTDGLPVSSINNRKKLDGYRGKRNGTVQTNFPVYLIGQIARNSKYPPANLSCKTLLDSATGVIQDAAQLVCGRLMLVECTKALVPFYECHGFKRQNFHVDTDSFREENLIQMIKPINNYVCSVR